MEFNVEYSYRDAGYKEVMNYKPAEGNKIIYKFSNYRGDYIGQTQKSVKQRAGVDGCLYTKSNTKWADAIKYFGFNDFSLTLLEECDATIANAREQFYIKQYNSWQEGFNSTPGGTVYNCGTGGVRMDKIDVRSLYDKHTIKQLQAWVNIYALLLNTTFTNIDTNNREELLDIIIYSNQELDKWWTSYSYYMMEDEYETYSLTMWELLYNFNIFNRDSVEMLNYIIIQYADEKNRKRALHTMLFDSLCEDETLGGDYLTSGDRKWTEFIFDYNTTSIQTDTKSIHKEK